MIRVASLDDLDAIMTLERLSFRADAWSEATMRADLASPHTWYVVAEEDERLIGYAGLRAPAGSKDADIQTIALDETARGRGLGRELFRTLLAEAARRRVREVFLDVRADNRPAQSLYSSEGFEAIGRRANYYPGEGVDAIVMKLDLTRWAAAEPSPKSDDRAIVGRSATDSPTTAAISDEAAEPAAGENPGGAA